MPGLDATKAYENIGHSEVCMTVKEAAVRLMQSTSPAPPSPPRKPAFICIYTALAPIPVGGAAVRLYYILQARAALPARWTALPERRSILHWAPSPHALANTGGFWTGFAAATGIGTLLVSVGASKLLRMTHIKSGFTRYPPYVKCRKRVRANPWINVTGVPCIRCGQDDAECVVDHPVERSMSSAQQAQRLHDGHGGV
ncbi:uncharacterized protein BP01DRAFT_386776 [Aspergillus saccharolyticus JOP 1030-1]|uniref:Uncharacterized protein n=1 Tax=Aspergillus saccharolyticus JOP 1030-1 TaxID=1450539 RepID=A0A318Z2B3_9EURO|nr:hypothetical protein BP01DRAFT_386776 [Aspergillus saccharolyticus JOP 1030-1]PYH41089.1 hypothetical protein BP01DRAFT_386776 [Aspergillus saccharolyticus JOP 1030-1]